MDNDSEVWQHLKTVTAIIITTVSSPQNEICENHLVTNLERKKDQGGGDGKEGINKKHTACRPTIYGK